MKWKLLSLTLLSLILTALTVVPSAGESADDGWVKKADVAQFAGADWTNLVKRVNGITVEEAKKIAAQDSRITFFFIVKGCRMVLPGKGVFHQGDVVFFSGKPWYGSAPDLADAYEKSGTPAKVSPDGEKAAGGAEAVILVYGRPGCGFCRGMMSRLDRAKMKYTFYDVDRDKDRHREMWKKIWSVKPDTRRVGFPVMDINGKVFIRPSFEAVQKAAGGR